MPADLRPVLKLGDIKFYRCPLGSITPASWQLLHLVQETTNADGDIIQLPYPGALLDQTPRYREAVRIMRAEKARHRQEQMEKTRHG